jgi:hypothetical protein
MMTKEEFQNVLRDDLCINCCLRRNGLCKVTDEGMLECLHDRIFQADELNIAIKNICKEYTWKSD